MKSRIGDILVSMGILTQEEANAAAVQALEQGVPLGEYMARGYQVSEADVYRALAEQNNMRFGVADDWHQHLDTAKIEELNREYLRSHHIIPATIDSVHHIITSNPQLDRHEIDVALGERNVPVILMTPTDFTRLWVGLKLGRLSKERIRLTPKSEVEEDLALSLENEFITDTWLVGLFGAILLDAVSQRASDIHFEAYEDSVRLRYRIDGMLRTIDKYPIAKSDLPGIVNVVKVNADLDIAERRKPQGGRFRRVLGDTVIDLRIQTQPGLFGENLVIRLLPQTRKRFSIPDLGFSPRVAEEYRKGLEAPSGMVLFVGPTGSGKTTSLYAGLSLLADDATRKAITVEDPIEYTIKGIMQTQVNRAVDFDFDQAVRVLVREDPDVILLGEIRDPETAREAIRASQTGHLVLSTLHCNDAPDAIQRLYDLDQHPNSIASELQSIYAQRLAPRICTHCKTESRPEAELAKAVFPDGVPAEFKTFVGSGCEDCDGSGIQGRVAVIEYLPVRATLRDAIAQHLSITELRAEAMRAGLVPMREQALSLIHQGKIPFSFLPRMILPEHLGPDDPDLPFHPDPASVRLR